MLNNLQGWERDVTYLLEGKDPEEYDHLLDMFNELLNRSQLYRTIHERLCIVEDCIAEERDDDGEMDEDDDREDGIDEMDDGVGTRGQDMGRDGSRLPPSSSRDVLQRAELGRQVPGGKQGERVRGGTPVAAAAGHVGVPVARRDGRVDKRRGT